MTRHRMGPRETAARDGAHRQCGTSCQYLKSARLADALEEALREWGADCHLLVGVDKPRAMSSSDIIGRLREVLYGDNRG